ncbi:hypothetical protein ACFQ5D_03605 [Paenibacillus farraposensis]|uniref:Uncharacterized protein n=1 Tax=Paenibacillus farraposensis TaxID=2807095 RepID=A0ABW4D9V7_9BACL|nr:hypothetical protein [Paenibacillus farraposensis]
MKKTAKRLTPPFGLAATFTNGHESWYSFLVGAAFSWKNVDYHYTSGFDKNGKGYMTGVSNVTSYLTGFQAGLSWTQTNNSSFATGKTAKLRVSGYYLFGAELYDSQLVIDSKANGPEMLYTTTCRI